MMAIRIVMMLPLGVLMGVLFGEHRIWLINTLRTASVTVFSIAAFVALQRGHGVMALCSIYAVVYTLEYVIYGLVALRTTPWLRVNLRFFDKRQLREVLGFSVSCFTANSSNVVLMRTDPLIVSAFLSLGAVAFYAIPLRITEQLFALSKQLINVFSPLYAQLHGSGRIDSVRAAYLTCTKLSLGMMIGFVIPAISFSADALRFWIGEEFAASSIVLSILLTAAILRTLQESSANALAMTGRHYFIARVSVASAVSNVVLSLLGVWAFGLVGVAFATLLSVAVFGALMTTVVACREYQIAARSFLRIVVAPIVVPSLVQLAAVFALYSVCPPHNMWTLFACGATSFLCYAAAYLLFSLRPNERAVLRHWFEQLASRLSLPMRGSGLIPGVTEASLSDPAAVTRQEFKS